MDMMKKTLAESLPGLGLELPDAEGHPIEEILY